MQNRHMINVCLHAADTYVWVFLEKKSRNKLPNLKRFLYKLDVLVFSCKYRNFTPTSMNLFNAFCFSKYQNSKCEDSLYILSPDLPAYNHLLGNVKLLNIKSTINRENILQSPSPYVMGNIGWFVRI